MWILCTQFNRTIIIFRLPLFFRPYRQQYPVRFSGILEADDTSCQLSRFLRVWGKFWYPKEDFFEDFHSEISCGWLDMRSADFNAFFEFLETFELLPKSCQPLKEKICHKRHLPERKFMNSVFQLHQVGLRRWPCSVFFFYVKIKSVRETFFWPFFEFFHAQKIAFTHVF